MIQIGGRTITLLTATGAGIDSVFVGVTGANVLGTVIAEEVENPVCLCESLTRADGTGETGTGSGSGRLSTVAGGNVKSKGRGL